MAQYVVTVNSDTTVAVEIGYTDSAVEGYLAGILADGELLTESSGVLDGVARSTFNPTTTRGDLIRASATATPGTLSRLAVGTANQVLTSDGTDPTYANGSKATLSTTGAVLYASAPNTLAQLAPSSTPYLYLRENGTGQAPTWARPYSWFNQISYFDWTWFTASSTTTAMTQMGSSTGVTTTDSTSQQVTDTVWGRFFQQATSAVNGNTTVIGVTSSAGNSAITAPAMKPLWVYGFQPTTLSTWGTDMSFVLNCGCSTTALPSTGTEEVQSVGFSSLSGDAGVLFCFTRAAGASTRETTGLTLSTAEMYYLIVDYLNFPVSVDCSVIRVSDATVLYTKTWSSGLPSTNTSLGRFTILQSNLIGQSAYNVRHKFIGVTSQLGLLRMS